MFSPPPCEADALVMAYSSSSARHRHGKLLISLGITFLNNCSWTFPLFLSCSGLGDKDREPVPARLDHRAALDCCSQPQRVPVSQEFIPINNGECQGLLSCCVTTGVTACPNPSQLCCSNLLFLSPPHSQSFSPSFSWHCSLWVTSTFVPGWGRCWRVSKRCPSADTAQHHPEQGKEAILLK